MPRSPVLACVAEGPRRDGDGGGQRSTGHGARPSWPRTQHRPGGSPGSSLHTKGLAVPSERLPAPKTAHGPHLGYRSVELLQDLPREGGSPRVLRLPLHAKPPSRTHPRPAAGLSGPVGTRWPGSHAWLWVLVPEPAGATRDLKASVSPSSRWRCLRAEDGAST